MQKLKRATPNKGTARWQLWGSSKHMSKESDPHVAWVFLLASLQRQPSKSEPPAMAPKKTTQGPLGSLLASPCAAAAESSASWQEASVAPVASKSKASVDCQKFERPADPPVTCGAISGNMRMFTIREDGKELGKGHCYL